MARRVVLGEEAMPASSPFHVWVPGAAILRDRWSESDGAGAGKQDRVFLLQVLGHWSGTSTGALVSWICPSAVRTNSGIILTFMYSGKTGMGG